MISMPYVAGQVIFLKVDRLIKLFMFILFCILIMTIYLKLSSKSMEIKLFRNKNNFQTDLSKYIHIDLKGAPPKADKFYETFFDFLEKIQLGVKGVIIEYEDTLPLQGNLVNITHRFGYTKSDIKLIQNSAKKHHLEIIPLIQTFGHLEWILKLNEFKSYRDDQELPTVISPCYNATYILLEDLLQQTLDMHPDSKIIHIGCDEVALKNLHKQCRVKHMNTHETYIDHIQRVVSIVQKIRPRMRVLIWDDILRNDRIISNKIFLNSLKNLVEPVSWNYFPKFDERYTSSSVWQIYPKFFQNNWIASAFKGGLHRYSIKTNTTHHALNNYQWLQFINSPNFPKEILSGIILTGWSRFDHFMPLCDLLPTAYPSLIYSLYVLNTKKYFNESNENCEDLLKSIGKKSELCELLPGISIWYSISYLSKLLLRIQSHLKLLNTVAPEYNRKHLFVRRYELNYFLSTLNSLKHNLLTYKQTLIRHLKELYSNDVINEWIDLYITPTENQINATFIEFKSVQDVTTWPRRPI